MTTTKARIEELKGRMAGAGIEFLRIENVNIKRPLTEAQMAEIAQEITEHVLESKRLEDEKKEETKRLKGLQDKEDAQSQALSTIYQDGHTNIDENCLIGFDKNRNVISIVDPVTGREVATRMVKDSDMQTTMPITPAETETPAGAPAAPEALALAYDGGKSDGGPIEVEGVVLDEEDMAEGLGEVKEAGQQDSIVEVVTQIASLTEKNGAMFVETPDGTFYSTDPAMHGLLEQAAKGRSYVELGVNKTDTRNQEIVRATIRPEVEDAPFEGELPDGVEDVSDELE